MFKFTYACIFYGGIKSELGQTFHTNIFPRVSIHYTATSLKPGSALGKKEIKIDVGKKKKQKNKKKTKKIGESQKVASHELKKLRTEATK